MRLGPDFLDPSHLGGPCDNCRIDEPLCPPRNKLSRKQKNWELAVLRILLVTAAIAACGIGAGMPADAKATVARLASSEDQPTSVAPTSVVVVKPDELRNARPRKKPRMVVRCALLGPSIQGCNLTESQQD